MMIKDPLKKATEQIQELIRSDIVKQLRNANEADVRLQLIDVVLEILGWDKSEYNPEHATPTRGFTDYVLSIDGVKRLIVEAKHLGVVDPLPKPIQHPEYSNSFLYNNCGHSMPLLLEQCIKYCASLGVPYALATTGEVWIVLVGYKNGYDWKQLNAVVFHSLDDVYKRFAEFYGLLSREAVKKHSLEDKFATVLRLTPLVAIRPSSRIDSAIIPTQIPQKAVIDAVFKRYMGDITSDSKKDMLEQCYVTNSRLEEFSHEIRQIWEYDPVLDESDKLQVAVDINIDLDNPSTILLVGNVGAGKSTFIHWFIQNVRPNRNVCVVVDLKNMGGVDIKPGRKEEEDLAGLVLENLAREFRNTVDPYDQSVLRGCFENETRKFTSAMRPLLQQDPRNYEIEEGKYLLELSKQKLNHLIGYIRYARKKNYKAWITFDNVDRGTDSYQAFIYAFAHRISDEAHCVTILTLREDTYAEAAAGFLDVRKDDKVFRIKPPEISKVVSKRTKYIDYLLEHGGLPKGLDAELIYLLNSHIKKLLLGDDKFTRFLVMACSLKNIREGLDMLRKYYTSYHSTFHEYYQNYKDRSTQFQHVKLDYRRENRRFIQALMLSNSWSYQPETADNIFNVFAVSSLEQNSHFLMLRILAYLFVKHNPSVSHRSIQYEVIRDYFIPLSHSRDHINDATRNLLYAGLIQSPTLPANPFKESKVKVPDPLPPDLRIALSLKGYYYLSTLVSHPYYQTRVGEDTVWYNEELASKYIECLQDSSDAQSSYGADDALQVTNARDIFLQYLRISLLEENQNINSRHIGSDWENITNIIETAIFGNLVTQLVDIKERNTLENSNDSIIERGIRSSSLLQFTQRQSNSREQATQTSFITDADYVKAIHDAVASVGALPAGLKVHKSRYIVRILWALEVAFQAGLGPQRSVDLAKIIREYGNEPVERTNVAQFFRNQRRGGEYIYLWNEDQGELYTINQDGRNMLISLLTSLLKEVS